MKPYIKLATIVAFYLVFISAVYSQNVKPPYPIIFVHGWAGNDETWKHEDGNWENYLTGLGLNPGGRINVCLEILSNTTHDEANSDVGIILDSQNPLTQGDFYFLNFDINRFGERYPDQFFGIENLQTSSGKLIYINPLDQCQDIHIGDIIVVRNEYMIVEQVNINVFNIVYSIVVERGALGSNAVPHLIVPPNLYVAARNLSNMSNQGSIVKGGIGIKKAIEKVKELNPGTTKVVIVAHSMGGLNSRQYIQNENSYNGDVAKLVTIDSPHLGSDHGDLSQFIFFDLSYDPRSDGARDMRYCLSFDETKSAGPQPPYGDHPDNAVFLYGGTENPIIWDLDYEWYSYDFNGDGIEFDGTINGLNIITNDNIWPNDVLLGCVIGKVGIQNNDDVVRTDRQTPNPSSIPAQYHIVPSDLYEENSFDIYGGYFPAHNYANRNIEEVVKGMDEPDNRSISYDISNSISNGHYITGFSTIQSGGGTFDEDFYKFVANSTGNALIQFYEIHNTNFWQLNIYSSLAGDPIASVTNTQQPGSIAELAFNIIDGQTYYIGFSSLALANSYLHPYKFYVSTQLSICSVQFDQSNYFPNAPATIIVTLCDGVEGANVTFTCNSQTYTCIDEGEGLYVGTFIVPSSFGTYPIVINASKFGYINSTSYNSAVVVAGEITLYNGIVSPNPGNTLTNFTFPVHYKDQTNQAPQYVKTIGTGWTLNMTGSGNYSSGVQFTANNTFAAPGTYSFYFEAKTASNEILRYPASGNLTLSVSQSAAGWDLTVLSFGTYYTPSNVQPGTVITVNANVKNQSDPGNTYTNVLLKAELFGPTGNKLTEDSETIASLGSGLSSNYTLNLTMPSNAANGNYQILVTVFPLIDNVPSNNSTSLSVYVGTAASNDQYAVPNGLEVIYTGQTVHIPPGSGNPAFVLWGINTSSGYVTFTDPSGEMNKIYTEHNKLWSSYGATIAVEDIDNTGSGLATIRPGNAVSNGPNFPIKTISTYPGQTITFVATVPSGRYFSGDEDDYPVYKPGTSSSPNLVRDWQTNVIRSNGNTTISISFAIPSNAAIDNYIFYQTTAYTTTTVPREHMTRLEIIVNSPPPQINTLSSYVFSADDQITITGTNFGTSQGTVRFYNNLNANILSWTNTQIFCRVPNGVQTGNVFVINSNGTSNGKPYTIISSTGDPVVVQPIPDQEMMPGETLTVATLSNVFSDPNNDPLVYTATSSSPEIITSINSGVLSIETTSTAAGQAQIVVSATDLDNATVQDEFTVNVIIPELTVVPESLIFGEVLIGMNSTPQSYSISGSNLISDILISAPAGFDVSFESGDGYSNSLILPNNDGTVNSTTIFARFNPTTPGSYSGSISNITAGATIQNVDVSGIGIVLPVITINPSTLAFGSIAVGSHSLAQPYVVTGSNLTESITVTAPAGFDLSATGSDSWVSSIALTPTVGNVNALVYVRFSPTEAIEYSGNITNASTGATTQNVVVSGTGIELNNPDITNSVNGNINAYYSQMITPATSYQVTATNLVGDLTIVANTQSSTPGNCQLEISLSPDQGFSTQLNLTPVDGSIDTTIYVKPGCDAVPVHCTGIITHSSIGAMDDIINVDLDNLYYFQYAPMVTIGNIQALPGTEVQVPVTATNFSGVSDIVYYIDYDPMVLTFNELINVHPSFPPCICNNCPNPFPGSPPSICCASEACMGGYFTINYVLSHIITIDPNHNRLFIKIRDEVIQFTIPDGEKLFDIDFNYTGGYSDLTFTDGYYYSGGSNSYLFPEIINEPFEDYYFNGSVSESNYPILTVSTDTLIIGDIYNYTCSVPVPFTISGSNLSSSINVVAENWFWGRDDVLISFAENGNYTNSLNIPNANGNANATAYVKICPDYFYPCIEPRIIVSSEGAENDTINILCSNIQFDNGNAPISTISDVGALSGSIVNVPINVKNFNLISRVVLGIEYNPSVLTFQNIVNMHSGMYYTYDDIYLYNYSSDLSMVLIDLDWTEGSSTIPDNEKLFDLQFLYTGGFSELTFNSDESWFVNIWGVLWEIPINDEPASYYYHDGSVGPVAKSVNLTLGLEGLYNSMTGSLNKAQGSDGNMFSGTIADKITVKLAKSTFPYNFILSYNDVNLDQNLTCSVQLPNVLNGEYYIVICHRNSLETWSSLPVNIGPDDVYYNFTDDANRAYGDNLQQINGLFCIYGGDVNQDDFVDSGDMTPVDNGSSSFETGYISADVNGDGLVDTGDMTIVDNNSSTFSASQFPVTPPTSLVTTVQDVIITGNKVVCGGEVTFQGNSPVLQRGICWSTESLPTFFDDHIQNGIGLGSFTCVLSGLIPNTQYYFRAYAYNQAGLSYGEEYSFETGIYSFGSGVTDFDGNTYTSVVLGSQEWLVENLKVTHYQNGNEISNITDNTPWSNLTSGAWCWYNNSNQYDNPYGKLYNWYVVADTRQLCPAGWHIPSDSEWTVLTDYLGGLSVADEKMKEAGIAHWPDPNSGTNTSGFTGIPGGYRSNLGVFSYFSQRAYWWSSSEYNTDAAWGRCLGFDYINVNRTYFYKKNGYSVRCLKN